MRRESGMRRKAAATPQGGNHRRWLGGKSERQAADDIRRYKPDKSGLHKYLEGANPCLRATPRST
jgi:hypothetical protein